jgi:hypothetical protein
MRSSRLWVTSSRLWMRSSRPCARSSRLWMRSSQLWMRSGSDFPFLIRIWILPQVFHILGNHNDFIHNSASLHCLIFLVSVVGVILIFGQYIDIYFRKKYSLALHMVEMDTVCTKSLSSTQAMVCTTDYNYYGTASTVYANYVLK